MSGSSGLGGRRVVVTRHEPGRLGELLESRGAVVVHVPLIAIEDPADGGAALAAALGSLGDYDWLIVTSPAGAERVGAAARRWPDVGLAAVGTTTAAVLSDRARRPVDVVPGVQRAAALAERFAGIDPARVLLALADRAPATLETALGEAGHDVTRVTAYRTVPLAPPAGAPGDADALVFASGSAAETWVDRFGTAAPPVVVAIGPATAEVARRSGLKVTRIAADHSLTGLVTELERCFTRSDSTE